MTDQNNAGGSARRADATGIRRLDIIWKRGAVTLVGETGGDVVATADPERSDEWSLERRGDSLVLEQNTEQSLLDMLEGRQLDVTVHVPASVAETDAKVGAGSVRVRDLRGRLDLKTGAGDIILETIKGQVDLKTGMGRVELRDVIGTVDAKTGHGDVTFQGLGGTLSLVTGNGNVTIVGARDSALDVTTGRGNVLIAGESVRSLRVKTGLGEIRCEAMLGTGDHDLKSGLGDVTVVIGEDVGVRVDAATGWGEIESDFPLVRVGRPGPAIFGGQRYVGSIGAGTAEVDLKLRTGKGDIQLRRLTTAGRVSPSPTPTPSPEPRPEPVPSPRQENSQDATPESSPVPEPWASVSDAPYEEAARSATDRRLAILEALRRGEISVDEAERRLRELE